MPPRCLSSMGVRYCTGALSFVLLLGPKDSIQDMITSQSSQSVSIAIVVQASSSLARGVVS